MSGTNRLPANPLSTKAKAYNPCDDVASMPDHETDPTDGESPTPAAMLAPGPFV